ncbi:uncharacterized protein F4817DRAFT_346769 [Daldinia loculata]|uniref:uncharacterized protein n=1 Tax=Daldinia loculata TaxID=103429 RepID=UPI0020C3C107|nr:uncharacterized protein F4817DRAFT_346769 [Daldinia loculata]KAI1644372.1 hypothetical protein F4817DRAFT_346769 [Daldinia loculata]
MESKHQPCNSVPTITFSEEMRQTGICPPSHIAEALGHLHHSGIVVLDNVVDVGHLDALNAMLVPEAINLSKTSEQRFNFGVHTGNISQAPPLDEAFMFSDVWANPFALRVLAAILGPTPVLHFASGNTALPATSRQPVHSDIDFPHPNFPFSFVVNIPLVDVTEDNGATEVWTGSHTTTSFSDQVLTLDQKDGLPIHAILPELVAQRQDISPPARACTRKGSIIIRDLRLWHAGLPNLTSSARVMLAFVWQASWWCGRGSVRLPAATQTVTKAWQQGRVAFRISAEWVDGKLIPQANGSQDTSLASSDATLLEMFSRSDYCSHLV